MIEVTEHMIEVTEHSFEPTEHSFEATQHSFEATHRSGAVSALLTCPANANCLLVLAHGAGAGMRHPFMEALAGRLAAQRIATFRYQFPYMEQGRRRPDFQPILLKTVRSAVSAASALSGELPLFGWPNDVPGRGEGASRGCPRNHLLRLSPPPGPEAEYRTK